ncbi:sigma-70 family RNA polymerase sigma factor [Actinoplanes sp. CA-142083]|uniref:sigma-70 family RNA polymerase sigma factor n=1 Tax=Actinoplanes sp. CA-142083 TaxID=3239903 RepID=UPI003D8F79F2
MDSKFSALRDEHGDALEKYLLGFTRGDKTEAEDLLQETMIRVWRNLDRVPPAGEQARRWLYTVARNVAIDALRARKARPAEVELHDVTAPAMADDTSDTVVAVQTLHGALGSLSEQHRRVVDELYLKGRSVAETARRLGLPAGTVKSRAHYAMRALREAFA